MAGRDLAAGLVAAGSLVTGIEAVGAVAAGVLTGGAVATGVVVCVEEVDFGAFATASGFLSE